MKNGNRIPGLTCVSNHSIWQILSEGDCLYIVWLGPASRAQADRAIREPSEFVPSETNHCLKRSQIEAIHCAHVQGRVAMTIVHDGCSHRFVVKDARRAQKFIRALEGYPVQWQSSGGAAKRDKWEMILFIACFALALVALLCNAVAALRGFAPWLALGWMFIPLAALSLAARQGDGAPFSFSLGSMAALFSCVFLWLTPAGRPDQWLSVLLPAIVAALVAVGAYALGRRRMEPLRWVAVGLAALLFYAPGAVLSLNQLPALRSEVVGDAQVVELTNHYNRGDWEYYAVVETQGVQTVYQISREEYALLNDGGTARIVQTVGSLGIASTDIQCQ